MVRPISVLPAVLLAITVVAAEKPAPFRAQAEASASLEVQPDGRRVWTLVGARFMHFDNMLLSERTTRIEKDGTDGGKRRIRLTALASDQDGYDRELWTLEADGDSGSPWAAGDFRFYKTTLAGSGGGEDAHAFYSLRTGAHFATFTADVIRVDLANTRIRRLVAYHSANAAIDPAEASGHKDLLGTLTLYSPSGAVDRIAVVGQLGAWTPKMTAISEGSRDEQTELLNIFPPKGSPPPKAAGGFKVILRFDDKVTVATIPVNDDAFQLGAAIAHKGKPVELKRIPIGAAR
jgi:hypothetical protein